MSDIKKFPESRVVPTDVRNVTGVCKQRIERLMSELEYEVFRAIERKEITDCFGYMKQVSHDYILRIELRPYQPYYLPTQDRPIK